MSLISDSTTSIIFANTHSKIPIQLKASKEMFSDVLLPSCSLLHVHKLPCSIQANLAAAHLLLLLSWRFPVLPNPGLEPAPKHCYLAR